MSHLYLIDEKKRVRLGKALRKAIASIRKAGLTAGDVGNDMLKVFPPQVATAGAQYAAAVNVDLGVNKHWG